MGPIPSVTMPHAVGIRVDGRPSPGSPGREAADRRAAAAGATGPVLAVTSPPTRCVFETDDAAPFALRPMTEGDLGDVVAVGQRPARRAVVGRAPHAGAGRGALRPGHPRARSRCGTGSGRSTAARSGFCQDYRISDHPEFALLCGHPEAVGFDYALGRGGATSTEASAPACCGSSCATSSSRRTTGCASCSPLRTTATPARCGCWTSSARPEGCGSTSRRATAPSSTVVGCRIDVDRVLRDEHPGRHLGLALPAVARRLLPRGAAPAPRAGVRRLAAHLDRDQRLVLLAAATLELCQVARRGARGLRLRGQGPPVRHAHEAAASTSRLRSPTSSPPGVLGLGPKLGPVLWQLPATFALRRADARPTSAPCCRAPPRGGRARPRARRPAHR